MKCDPATADIANPCDHSPVKHGTHFPRRPPPEHRCADPPASAACPADTTVRPSSLSSTSHASRDDLRPPARECGAFQVQVRPQKPPFDSPEQRLQPPVTLCCTGRSSLMDIRGQGGSPMCTATGTGTRCSAVRGSKKRCHSKRAPAQRSEARCHGGTAASCGIRRAGRSMPRGPTSAPAFTMRRATA